MSTHVYHVNHPGHVVNPYHVWWAGQIFDIHQEVALTTSQYLLVLQVESTDSSKWTYNGTWKSMHSPSQPGYHDPSSWDREQRQSLETHHKLIPACFYTATTLPMLTPNNAREWVQS